MQIQVKLFALYRDLAGTESLCLQVPQGASVKSVLEAIREQFPRLRQMPDRVLVAVNLDYASPDQLLAEGDEVAIIPPVAGGSGRSIDRVAITEGSIFPAKLLEEVAVESAGAVVLFLGTVRNQSMGRQVLWLQYEAYVDMAEKKLAEVVQELRRRWDVNKVVIEHRIGKLELGTIAVAVVVAAPHRAEAFEAGRFAIDTLKETVPIWKKERYTDGEVWVDPQPEG